MARLIKSEKEVEGRYEEVWTLVDEDALVQWPAGPGDVVGRDAPRLDGFEKARGEARYTADVQLPGMLHTALLHSPHARCRVRRIDLAAADGRTRRPRPRSARERSTASARRPTSRATRSPPSPPRRSSRPRRRSR